MSTQAYAFFDVDDTLISVKSMFGFIDHWFSKYPNEAELERFNRDMERRHEKDVSWEELNRLFYMHFEGRNVDKVMECGQEWFDELEKNNSKLYHTAIIEILEKHLAENCKPVFVSGSFPAVLNPVALRLGVDTILAINMEIEDGCYTGRILPPQTIGEGKAEAVRNFLAKKNVLASDCYAYGDDISDLPMLKAVGHPRVVRGGRSLVEHTKDFGWPVLEPYLA